jgi:murein DD-endopeptidase MepM/ murein hydrolase activator NlpD
MDLAGPQGTAIETAAPGYVARVYKGQDYGYYVMIIHANGFATLYAHMSRIDVEVDQYVGRGQVIGLTGGRPGTSGAGFSTGPHLHFEVRLNGIPVNPLAYLDLDQL